MKVLVIVGSGKIGGNTDQLCDAFAEGLAAAGHEVIKFHLGRKKVGPCTGCNVCRISGICAQNDDFEEGLDAFMDADMLVLSTSLYFWSVSAHLKAWIDRLYSVGEKDPKGFYFTYPKKKVFLLATCADISSHFYAFDLVEAFYHRLVRYMKWEDMGSYYATGCGGSSMPRRIEDTKHLKAAFEIAQKIH